MCILEVEQLEGLNSLAHAAALHMHMLLGVCDGPPVTYPPALKRRWSANYIIAAPGSHAMEDCLDMGLPCYNATDDFSEVQRAWVGAEGLPVAVPAFMHGSSTCLPLRICAGRATLLASALQVTSHQRKAGEKASKAAGAQAGTGTGAGAGGSAGSEQAPQLRGMRVTAGMGSSGAGPGAGGSGISSNPDGFHVFGSELMLQHSWLKVYLVLKVLKMGYNGGCTTHGWVTLMPMHKLEVSVMVCSPVIQPFHLVPCTCFHAHALQCTCLTWMWCTCASWSPPCTTCSCPTRRTSGEGGCGCASWAEARRMHEEKSYEGVPVPSAASTHPLVQYGSRGEPRICAGGGGLH